MLEYKNTSEIEPSDDIIVQSNVKKAIELGLNVDDPHYNIYVSGESGIGKGRFVRKILSNKIGNKYNDWCYLYNFDKPNEPISVSLQPGIGKILKKDIESMFDNIFSEIRNVYESEEYELGKRELSEKYKEKKENLLKKMKLFGKDKGFDLKNTSTGVAFVYKDCDEEEVNDKEDEEFEKGKKELEKISYEFLSKYKELDDLEKEAILELQRHLARLLVNPMVKDKKIKYKYNETLQKYFDFYEKNVLEDIEIIYNEGEGLANKIDPNYFKKYNVNLFVDNSSLLEKNEVPVIVELNPTIFNLFGRVEYDYLGGSVKTDFTKLYPGSVHFANGGYLILYADQLFRNPLLWETIKKCLRSRSVDLETQTVLRPESIPLNLKIIVIGSREIYYKLYKYEEDFRKYFKVIVDFEDNIDNNISNKYKLAEYIALKCNESNLKHLNKDAVDELINYCIKLSGDREKVSLKIDYIDEILIESDYLTVNKEQEFVTKENIKEAIRCKKERLSNLELRMRKSVEQGFTLIDTSGKRVGVVNGLSVVSIGGNSFGSVSRITATSSIGSNGVINIEKSVNLSGSIHSKGVLILSGYLSNNFAKDFPLSINSYLCFEQNYNGIDGDSASLAELYALLSSLSNVPIKQSIAVTGSINQLGDVQVVGGISDKVEGFYSVCKLKGLSAQNGIIMPRKNMKNFLVSDEIQESIEKNEFKIYLVDKVDDVSKILMGVEFIELKKLVSRTLKNYSDVKK